MEALKGVFHTAKVLGKFGLSLFGLVEDDGFERLSLQQYYQVQYCDSDAILGGGDDGAVIVGG